MKHLFLAFVVILYTSRLFSDNPAIDQAPAKLQINIFCKFNGLGVEADQKLLKSALEGMGHTVRALGYWDAIEPIPYADINLFIESLNPDRFSWAPKNWFIPNPEWCFYEQPILDKLDLILCRTKEVERIFRPIHKNTYFLGFTSSDAKCEVDKKNYSLFVHLPGSSGCKGTSTILNIWQKDYSLPPLTVVAHGAASAPFKQDNFTWIGKRLPESSFRTLQNSCGVHLCPSTTEGFGHYIMEAMSTQAVVITTDAPPMNEFITDPRCLVPYSSSDPVALGTNYRVDPDQLRKKIKAIANLPKKELKAIGSKNRKEFLRRKEEFYSRLNILMTSVSVKN